MITPVELSARMKTEILDDVQKGIVPVTVASFSELHDYVDANVYGGTESLLDELDSVAPDTDEGHSSAMNCFCKLANAAMDIVDVWIKSGAIRKAFAAQAKS
jgi:hypothetical protein